jgi:DHA1 family tetracycline resistance protein-like MFS transporter
MAFGLAGTYFVIYLAHQCLPAIWVLYTSYRYHWTVGETGVSLAIVGLMAAIVQGGLTRVIVRRVGEQKAALGGLAVATLTYVGYGLAT